MSRRTTKQRRAARRRRLWVQGIIARRLARSMLAAICTPARRWFSLGETPPVA